MVDPEAVLVLRRILHCQMFDGSNHSELTDELGLNRSYPRPLLQLLTAL